MYINNNNNNNYKIQRHRFVLYLLLWPIIISRLSNKKKKKQLLSRLQNLSACLYIIILRYIYILDSWQSDERIDFTTIVYFFFFLCDVVFWNSKNALKFNLFEGISGRKLDLLYILWTGLLEWKCSYYFSKQLLTILSN